MTAISSHDTWETWREKLWTSFVRLESTVQCDDFFGKVTAPIADSKRMNIVASTRQVTERTTENIRTDPHDLILLALQKSGEGFVEQGGRQARLGMGDFALFDTTLPYKLFFDNPFEQIVLQLPRQRVAECIPNISNLTGRKFHGTSGPGLVLAGFVKQLSENGGGLSDTDLVNFEGSTVQMLTTAIRLSEDDHDDERHRRLNRLKSRMLRNLRDPSMDLTEIATLEGMRLRTMQRLFQLEGTSPKAWVLDQRLAGVAQDLRSPAEARRSITDIAFSWGFSDLSHFSRSFGQKFGSSARAWRADN